MAKSPAAIFTCTACGATHRKWAGRCEACGAWNSISEEAPLPTGPSGKGLGAARGRTIPLTTLSTEEPPPPGNPALAFAVGIPLLALEILKILTRAAFPVTRGRLWRLGHFDGSVGVHPVLKLPRCPVCGAHRRTPPRRIWEE